jgi:hypothetical protein
MNYLWVKISDGKYTQILFSEKDFSIYRTKIPVRGALHGLLSIPKLPFSKSMV